MCIVSRKNLLVSNVSYIHIGLCFIEPGYEGILHMKRKRITCEIKQKALKQRYYM